MARLIVFAAAALQRGVIQTVTHEGRAFAFLKNPVAPLPEGIVQPLPLTGFVSLSDLFGTGNNTSANLPSAGDSISRIPQR